MKRAPYNHFSQTVVTGSRAHVDYLYLQQQYQALDKQFIQQHPASPVNAFLLYMNARNYPADTIKEWFYRLPEKVQKSQYGQALVQQLKQQAEGIAGTRARNVSGTDINGQPLQLADFKGKYVLIDFWASWCVPCRKGNPHLKALYAKYKNKGFEIIGISDDDTNPKAWRKAVEKDDLPWKQLLRGMKVANKNTMQFDKTADNTAGYNVASLPTQVLIDPTGTVIGRYSGDGAREDELDKQLESIFH